MYIRDIMTKSFYVLDPKDNFRKAAALLRQSKLDVLPVVGEDGKLIGVLTKPNLFDAISAGVDPNSSIERFITRKVETVDFEITTKQFAEVARTSRVGTGVVINRNNEVMGIVTKAQWIMAMYEEAASFSRQLRTIYDTMHNGLIVVDRNGIVQTINHAAERILYEYHASLCIGDDVGKVFHSLDLDRVTEAKKTTVEVKHVLGQLRLVCNVSPLVDSGMITHVIIVFQALSDLEQVAEEFESVRKLCETLKSVMELAYDGIIVVDKEGIITMANQAAAEFFLQSGDSIVGKPAADVIENTKLPLVAKTGISEINQLQFIGGTPFVISNLPILQNGEVIGAVGKILFRHLEEIKTLSEKLQAMEQLSHLRIEAFNISKHKIDFGQIITVDPAFRAIKEEAEIAARGYSNVLITGESGTGKEMLAQAIHNLSRRSKGPLIQVNCAAIPDNLLESEFFGYAGGAFTGALKRGKVGKLQMADGGTLFLDEIGDMSLNLQSKLLRVIQDGIFEAVGSNQAIKVDIRIIAATNQPIEEMVKEKRFRADLYYRLNVIRLHVPPLRARPGDIPLLVNYFIDKYNSIFSTKINGISNQTKEILLAHDWPGNVRELENVIERAINFARGKIIEVTDLPPYLLDHTRIGVRQKELSKVPLFKSKSTEWDKDVIVSALVQAKWNKAKAAKILGMSRSWLYEKIALLNLSDEKLQ